MQKYWKRRTANRGVKARQVAALLLAACMVVATISFIFGMGVMVGLSL